MLQTSIFKAFAIFGGLFLLTGIYAYAQDENFTSMGNVTNMENATNGTAWIGNVTNSTSAMNATNATSTVSTIEGEQTGKIADAYGELDNP